MKSVKDRISYFEQQADKESKRFRKVYGEHIRALENYSPLSRIRTVTPFDVAALGQMLENWDWFSYLVHENTGSIAALGPLPKVALDVITLAYGSSPMSVFSSVQPIPEQKGMVYFKELIAKTTRGNVTANDKLLAAGEAPSVIPSGFAGDEVTETLNYLDSAGSVSYAGNLAHKPVIPERTAISVTYDGSTYTCKDYDGVTDSTNNIGNLMGVSISGTVNYTTGAVSITLGVAPSSGSGGNGIQATYATDFEKSDDIPETGLRFASKHVCARIFALKQVMGMFEAYTMKKRFKISLESEATDDLVNGINTETTATMIQLLNNAAQGLTQWNRRTPTGVSWFEHKQSLVDSIGDADSVMLGNAGRGTINVIIAGRFASAKLASLPGWSKIADATTIGPHIYGTINGITVIRVPSAQTLDTNRMLCIYKGASPFEAAAVYSPFMPLVMTGVIPLSPNPLTSQKAVAVWAGTDVLVPNFATKLDIIDQAY